jgi:hypothetical protein
LKLATKAQRGGGEAGRPLLPDELRMLLRDKFDDPMLGIYGAHLLLLEKSLDTDLFNTVVANLRALLFEHPDVQALALRSEKPPQAPFNSPPMLSRSWDLIVEASIEQPNIVTPSLARWSSGNFLGEGPWHVGLSVSMVTAELGDLDFSDFEVVLAEELGVMKRIRQILRAEGGPSESIQSPPTSEQLAVRMEELSAGPELSGSVPLATNVPYQGPAQDTIAVKIDRDTLRSMALRFQLPADELRQRIMALENKMERSPAVPNLSVSLK